MSQIPKQAKDEAREILQQNSVTVSSKLDSLHQKIVNQPRYSSLIQKWTGLKDYLLSSQVPLSKRALILGGIMWIVIPDPLLGPVDDIVVATFLIPYISSELDKFQRGDYAKTAEPQIRAEDRTETANRFFFPELC
ncbi:MAG: FF domain-containing protein [Desulfococcaceae bacterium]|jgi:hypothetical protein|nr:FF domain-containing protein [Desulfococcaceae bacterium]